MTWLLLALWWVLLPAIPEWIWLHWLVHLVTVSLLALLVARRLWSWPRVHLCVPVLATLAAAASLVVAMHASPERFPSTERWWAGMTGLGHALFFLVALAMVPAGPGSGRDAGWTIDGRFGESDESRQFRKRMLALLLGVLIAQVIVVLRFDLGQSRILGGLGNPNTLGALAASFALALAGFGRWHPKVLVFLPILAVIVVLTESRGAAASGTLVLLLFAARRSWRWVVGLGVALGLALVFIPNPLWERVLQLKTDHAYSRPFMWRVALDNVLVNPLGIGPSMNRYVFPIRALDTEFPWLVHQRHAVGLTHNVFLTLALEWGWLAGAASIGLALWTLARILPRRPPDPLAQGATLGALVLFCELQIDGLEQNAAVFSMFLLFAAITIRRSGALRGPTVPARAASLFLVAAAIGLLSQAAVRTHHVSRLQQAQDAWRAYQMGEGDETQARAILEWADQVASSEEAMKELRFRFEMRVYLRARGGVVEEEELDVMEDRVWDAAEAAQASNPADAQLARSISDFAYRVLTEVHDDGPARARYFVAVSHLLRLDPLDVSSRRQLVREYASDEQYGLMEEAFDELCAIEPDDAAAWVLIGRYRSLNGDQEGALYAYVRAREAVFNCRVKATVGAPRSRQYFAEVLRLVDLPTVRRRIAELRREIYL